MWSSSGAWILFFVLAFVRNAVGVGFEVQSLRPSDGSYNGGVRIEIAGDFPINPFNSGVGPEQPEIEVYFVGDSATYVCDVEKDSTHETQVGCYTRPMPVDTYTVKVIIDGMVVSSVTNCRCTHRTHVNFTPLIQTLYFTGDETAFAGLPRSLITVHGKIFSDIYGSNSIQFIANGNERSIRRVYAGPEDCNLHNDTAEDDDTLYGLELNEEGSQFGQMTCRMNSEFVGNNNFSFIVTDYGRSAFEFELMRVNAENKLYMFQTHAEITGISPAQGSRNGGTMITINGNFFDPQPLIEPKVFVGGQPCEIVEGSLTDTEMKCVTAPEPDVLAAYPGSRGVKIEKWLEANYLPEDARTALNASSPNYFMWYQDSALYVMPAATEENTVVKMTGMFEVPVDDLYQFYLKVDDRAVMYMSCDGDASNAVEAVSLSSWTSSWHTRDAQRTEWMELTKGQLCYYEAIARNYGSGGRLEIGALRATTTLTSSQSGNVHDERQDIRWSTDKKLEKQTISLVNWTAQTTIDEIQEVAVTSNCFQDPFPEIACGAVFFTLEYRGRTTPELSPMASFFEVEHALEYIFTSDFDDVDVTAVDSNSTSGDRDGTVYTITFRGNMGDYPDLIAAEFGVNVTVTEITQGLPNFNRFSIDLFGRETESMPVTASAESVQEKLHAAKGAICPDGLLGSGALFKYARDYEDNPNGWEHGKRVDDVPAFCGSRSLRNPWGIFDFYMPSFTQYELDSFPWLCLAHRGLFKNRLKMLVTYFEGWQKTHWVTLFEDEIPMQEDEWDYECYNLRDAILAQIPDALNIEILRIGDFRTVTSDGLYYFDALLITSQAPTSYEDLADRRRPPVLHGGKMIKTVTVTKADEDVPTYDISFDPHDCGHNFPLLSVVNARDAIPTDMDGADFASTHASNWPSEMAVDVTRTEAANLPMSGTFDLSYENEFGVQTLLGIPGEISASSLEALLETWQGVGDMAVSDLGVCYARRFRIQWVSNGGDKNLLQVYDSAVTGEPDLTLRRHEDINGGAFHAPIGGDMLRLLYDKPQVEVIVNGIQSSCGTDCSFEYSAAATPTLISSSPAGGLSGTALTISGTGLDEDASGSIVSIGGVECTITSQTESTIQCTTGVLEYGEHEIDVLVGGKGYATQPNPALTFDQEASITAVNPEVGFVTGGAVLMVIGEGFSDETIVTVGGIVCPTLSFDGSTILCMIPPFLLTGIVNVELSTNDSVVATLAGAFEYSAGAPVVTSVIPTTIDGPGGDTIQIHGTGFGTDDGAFTVHLDAEPCDVTSVTDILIECTAPYMVPGSYSLEILYIGAGLADITTNSIPDITYQFSVTSVAPATVSLFGGTEMTIEGVGFNDDTSVEFGGIECAITGSSNTRIYCTSGSTASLHVVTNDGVHPTAGSGYAWDPPVVTVVQGDIVQWEWELDPLVTDLNEIEGIIIYQTDSPDSDVEMAGGFKSGDTRTIEGKYARVFSTAGTFYYSTGYIDDPNFGNIKMHGTVQVLPYSNLNLGISVSSNGIEADISLSVRKKRTVERRKRGSCTPLNEGIDNCTVSARKKREASPARVKRGAGSLIILSDADKAEILHDHNNARMTVSPPGSDIILMSWDDELAADAEAYATACTWGHSSGRTHSIFTSVGENLAIFTRTSPLSDVIATPVENWDAERADYTFSNLSCADGKVCGHYTQVVWHNSYAVGCGVAECNEDDLENDPWPGTDGPPNSFDGAYLVVCQYGYAGNFVGQAPYSEGAACSNCPVEFPACDATYSLCTVSEPDPDPGMEVVNECVVGSVCFTPVVTDISDDSGIMGDTLTITGNGFGGDKCRITVSIGENIDCAPVTTSNTEITCLISPEAGAAVGELFEVTVNVLGYGNAFMDIENDDARWFALLPSISSITPTSGSTQGGTEVTIIGAGFVNDTDIFVGTSCEITDLTYFQVKCETAPGGGIQDVLLFADGFEASCTTTCEFEYDVAETPTVDAVEPTIVDDENEVIEINGTGFILGAVTVYAGDVECSVDSSSSTQISCIIAELVAGSHLLSVHVDNKGYADVASGMEYIQGLASAVLDPITGGTEGTIVQFVGSGFNSEDLSIEFDGEECSLITKTNFEVTCISPPGTNMQTASVVITSNGVTYPSLSFTYDDGLTPVVTDISPDTGDPGDTIILDGTLLDELESGSSVLIGGTPCTISMQNSTAITCVLGMPTAGGGNVPAVFVGGRGFAVTSAVTFTYLIEIASILPMQGSHGGGNLVTIDGTGFRSGTVVMTGSVPCDVYDEDDLLLPGASVSYSSITCVMGSSMADPTIDVSNVITLDVDGSIVVSADDYTFSASLTPVVTDVTPGRGGTGGGTNITITGTGFSNSIGDVTVTIDGSICDVTDSTLTEIKCTTNAHTGSIQTSVMVNIASMGQAYDDGGDYFYIDVWSSPFTWGGRGVPPAGTLVEIPADQTIMIDEDTAVLKMLLINGGKVIFDQKDIELNAVNILIANGGHLEIGTEEEPFEHKAIITLHGHLRDIEIPIYGTKTLAVRQGTLDLHGKHVPIPWTYLGATAPAGSSSITLVEEVTWGVGDYIVIASTGDRHSQRENEKRMITGVSGDKLTLDLDNPLDYEHLGESETLPDGTVLETRAEIGLLTRNVVVRGSRNIEWNDQIPACPDGFNTGEFAQQTCFQGRFGEEMGSDQFGGQIMFHHPVRDIQEAFGRISYVELSHMGQAFRLGRYAIHFHIMGDMNYTNYVRGCAIHETFNRAITIHFTHRALVERNVVYDAMGGAIFIEDGIETENIIQNNLVVFCKQSTSLQNEDITPAGIWVTNPNNIVRHNAVAGGTHFGYWYRMHENPDGPSFTTAVCQQREELGEFFNNTAHSVGWFGLWVFQTYTPKEGGCCGCNPNSIAAFEKLVAWNCQKGLEFVQVGSLQAVDCLLFNNKLAGIEVKMLMSTVWGEAGIFNSVIVGHSTISGPNEQTESGMILPYSDGWMVENVTFINFDRPGGSVFSTTTITGTCGPHCGGFHSRFKGIEFYSADQIGYFRWEHENFIEDMDGTLTGTGIPKTVVAATDTAPDSCVLDSRFGIGPNEGMVCESTRLHRIGWNGVKPTSLTGVLVNLTNAYGTTQIPFEKKRMTHKPGWMALLFDGVDYTWQYAHLEKTSNITYNAVASNYRDGDCTIIRHPLTQNPDRFNVAPGQEKNSTAAPLDCATNYYGDYYFDETTKVLEYMINGRDPVGRKKRFSQNDDTWADPTALNRAIFMNSFRCFYVDCLPPPDPNTVPPARERPDVYDLWSDPSIWGGTLPVDYDPVTIETGRWIVADIDLPKFDMLWIEGVLELDWEVTPSGYYKNFTIEATYIFIRGGRLIIGWEDNLFRGLVNIILTGTRDTEEFALVQGVNMGAKVIGVFGGLDVHGTERTHCWVHLAETALAGANTITLDTAVDWEPGEEIVITPTAYQPWEAETFMILSVSADSFTLTLNDTLQYDHLGEDYTYANGMVTIAAEVGLLTRNIKIIGQEYPGSDAESFGGRIFVGQYFQESTEYSGYARISNVAFERMGQEGYSDSGDPRYSLVYWRTGDSSSVKPSYVKKSAFFRNFNTAIGAFLANLIEIEDNVVHHTVGSGIRLEGTGNRLVRNLVTLTLDPGTYRTRNDVSFLWYGGIEVSKVVNVFLAGNAVAGSERAAYWIRGEPCDDATWGTNFGRTSLEGVYINKNGQSGCTMVKNFHLDHCYDFGIYYQDASSVIIDSCVVTDSTVGIITLINGPSATAHIYEDKTAEIKDTTLVAVTESGICPFDGLDPNQDFLQSNNFGRAPRRGRNGGDVTSGILGPSFMSGHNAAPKKPFPGLIQYPAMGGRMTLEGVTFINYGDSSCPDVDHVAFMTNPSNEDYQHPVYMSGIIFENTPVENRIFYHRPSLSQINPSNCVDMECDALKNMIITDEDGSLLGSPGSVIPQAEFGWDDPAELSRGLGDFRIPKTLLTHPNGSRIDADDLAPNKGILRANDGGKTCTYNTDWQAYVCHGYDHQLFIIESLDWDTETRRLSPVALFTEGYIDLENGPADHGWCAGYTCQNRISTFFTTTAIGYNYEIHFSGSNPQQLRLFLPHAAADEAIVVGVYYSTSNRLDVYYDGEYVVPKNGDWDGERLTTAAPSPENPDEYMPLPDDPTGSNFYSRERQTIYITISGNQPVDISISNAIFLKFGVPSVTTDEFFEDLLRNLALLFNLEEGQIWIVDIIREEGKRKKRQTGTAEIVFGIGTQPQTSSPVVPQVKPRSPGQTEDTVEFVPPDETTQAALDTAQAVADELAEIASVIVNELQTNPEGVTKALGVEISEPVVSEPLPTAIDPEWEERADDIEEGVDFGPVLQIPDHMEIVTQPGPNFTPAQSVLDQQPVLKIVDADGDVVPGLGTDVHPWLVSAEIVPEDPGANLFGMTTVPFVNGYSTYTNLGIDMLGEHQIYFFVSFPNVTEEYLVLSEQLSIAPPLISNENCSDEEGDERFDRLYNWGENCSVVCLQECDGGEPICHEVECCGPHASCVSSKCVCDTFDEYPHGAFSDEIDYEELLNPVVNCMPNYIEIRLDKCGMNALGYYLDDLYVFGPGPYSEFFYPRFGIDDELAQFIQSCEHNDCRGYLSPTEDGVAYSFIVQGLFTDCNAEVYQNATYISYKNIVHGFGGHEDGPVSWHRPIEVHFSCHYMRRLFRTMDFYIDPFIRTVALHVEGEGNFNVIFGVWKDPMYNVPVEAPGATFHVPDYIYLGLELEIIDATLFLDSCKATLTSDYDDPTYRMLIENGCGIGDEVSVGLNGESYQALFAFKSFVFTDHVFDTHLWIHCRVEICVSDHSHCTADCDRRRRRAVPHIGSGKVVTIGPIKTVDDTPSRKKRSILHESYINSFTSDFAMQELMDAPFERTLGVGFAEVKVSERGSG